MASAHSLNLTQYMIRLQFEGLATPGKKSQSFDEVRRVFDKAKPKRRRLDPDHPDFDSEDEYGRENDDESEQADADSIDVNAAE